MHNQIFISYSRIDKDIAWKIYHDLLHEGYPVWIDKKEIKEGDKWRPQLEHHIKKSNRVIVLISNNSIKSGWVNHEGSISFALGHQLLPAQIEEKLDHIPVWVEDIQLIDFHNKSISYEDHYKNLKQHLGDSVDLRTLQRHLDQTVENHRSNEKILLDEVSLTLIRDRKDKLIISKEAERLIEKSRLALEVHWEKIGILENRVRDLERKHDESKLTIEDLTSKSWYEKFKSEKLGIELQIFIYLSIIAFLCSIVWALTNWLN